MDYRRLQYFLTLAREGSITAAADALHMTQPPLSRALKEMEEDLGVCLFYRQGRGIVLSEEGKLFLQRAKEITELFDKTRLEIAGLHKNISGEVYIGAGETENLRLVARAFRLLQQEQPLIRCHLSSGDRVDVLDQLDRGLIDFGVVFGPVNPKKYDSIAFGKKEIRGILMRRDSELADRTEICPQDLAGNHLMITRQANTRDFFQDWAADQADSIEISATFSLIYNASRFVAEGTGCALTIQGLVNTEGTDLCFRPLAPYCEVEVQFVWKKERSFSRAAQAFLQKMQQVLAE